MSKQIDVDVLGGVFRDFIFYGDLHATDLVEIPGGTGYNVYMGLKVLNIGTIFHGSIGYDWPFERIGKVSNKKSGVFVSRNETETVTVYRGANLYTSLQNIKSEILFATLECGGELFVKYTTDAKFRNKDTLIIVDPTPIFEWKMEYLKFCDVIIPNKDEYKIISADGIPAHLTVFEKLGGEGGRYIKKNNTYYVPAHNKGRFPLGCGDAFDVAVISGILKHAMPAEILKKAVHTGSSASLIRGSSTAVVKATKENVDF